LDKVVLAAKKAATPIVGEGLQKTGLGIANAGTFVGKKFMIKVGR